MTVSQSIARFVHTLDIDRVPPEVAEKTRVCLLNGYGIGLGCHDTPFTPVARRAAIAMDGEVATGATLARRRTQDEYRRRLPRQFSPFSRARAGRHLRRRAPGHDHDSPAHRPDRVARLSPCTTDACTALRLRGRRPARARLRSKDDTRRFSRIAAIRHHCSGSGGGQDAGAFGNPACGGARQCCSVFRRHPSIIHGWHRRVALSSGRGRTPRPRRGGTRPCRIGLGAARLRGNGRARAQLCQDRMRRRRAGRRPRPGLGGHARHVQARIPCAPSTRRRSPPR